MSKPKATVEARDRWRLDPDKTHVDEKGRRVQWHVGTETIRRAKCPQHPKITTAAFEGVTVAGWLFHCPGGDAEPHTFVAEPAS